MAAPVITSLGGGDTATVFVAENNLAAGGVITATSDAGWSIGISGGDDAGQFQINPMKGFLLYNGAVVFDFEHPTDTDHNNSYIVTVRASNVDGFDEQTVTIIVTDVAPLIVGDGGNNTLFTTLENDTINGLGGDDTAVFTSDLIKYSLQDLGSRITSFGPDEHDTLLSIEHLRFADGTIDVNDGSTVFDTVFYDRGYLDVFHAGVNALNHYNTSGWHEGRDPNAFFSTRFYLAANSDVRVSGVNPLDQYHSIGWKEGRDPSPNFDTKLYLLHNPDVAAAGVDPLEHYLQHGIAEGRVAYAAIGSSVGGFDAEYYVIHNPDVAAAGVDPLAHFQFNGWHEGRNPNALFDTAGYLSHYTDVAAANINPLEHYMQYGWKEGRDPSAAFDTAGYLAANPDVTAAHVNPLQHYLQFGVYEGRVAVSDGMWS